MKASRLWFILLASIFIIPNATIAVESWKQILDRADSLCQAAEYDSALVIGSMALEKAREQYGPEDTTVALVLHRLGVYHWLLYQLSDAESFYTRALHIRERQLGSLHTAVAASLNNLAMVYGEKGNYAAAEPMFRRALSIVEGALGPDNPKLVSILTGLGKVCYHDGKWTESEAYDKRALAIAEKAFGPDHPQTITCMRNLSTDYDRTGRYTEAVETCKRTLATAENALGPDYPDMAGDFRELANNYYGLGRYAESEGLYKRALVISEKKLGLSHPDVAASLVSLADIYVKWNRLDEAESLATRAEAINEKSSVHSSYALSWPLDALGTIHVLRAEFALAETFFQRSLAVVEEVCRSEHEEVVLRLDALGRLYYIEERFAAAESLFQRAYDGARRTFAENTGGLSEQDALTYSQLLRFARDHYLSSLVRSQAREQGTALREADAILSGKGQVSDEMFERQRAMVQEKDSATLALAENLRYARFQLSQLFASGPDSNIAPYRQKVDSLSRFANDLEGELSQKSSSYRQKKDYQDVSTERVASLLPVNSALVEYVRYNYLQLQPDSSIPHYLAMVLKSDQKPVIVDLGGAEAVDQLVEAYRKQMQTVSMTGRMPSPVDLANYKRITVEIYSKVWKPVERSVGKSELLFIAGDGALNLVSFAGLPTEKGGYLIEDHAIQYLSSGRDLMRLKEKSVPANGLLALGDPDFDALPSARIPGVMVTQTVDVAATSYAMRNVRSGCGTLSDIAVKALPGTRTEVEQIVSQWKGATAEPVAVYYGAQAKEDNVKKGGSGARVMHLATHGYFLEGACQPKVQSRGRGSDNGFVGENPLLLSGLLFAGANLHGVGADSAGVDDGILSAYEVSGMDLKGTDLVVLSACETGLGEVKAGEGVYGLRRAFQMAGARTVVSALWPVSDQITAEMMGRLYNNASGQSLAERMRQMQLEQLKKLRGAKLPDHPFLWGAFVATGDWR